MMRFPLFVLAGVAAFWPGSIRADGLIFQLPRDGTSVRYEGEIEEKNRDRVMKVKLTLASVGTATEGSEKCRWIELQMTMERDGREQKQIYKMLIPEKHLQRGASPIDHVVRAWQSRGSDARELKDPASARRPLPAFLSGPPKKVEKLKNMTFESKLGKLECNGFKGTRVFEEDKVKAEITYTTWLHKKSPFGVVKTEMEFEITRDDRVREKGVMRFKYAASSTGAKAEIPDS